MSQKPSIDSGQYCEIHQLIAKNPLNYLIQDTWEKCDFNQLLQEERTTIVKYLYEEIWKFAIQLLEKKIKKFLHDCKKKQCTFHR